MNKEGEILRNYFKGTGLKMGSIAEKLAMSRQNLNYHLAKEVLDKNFVRLANEELAINVNDILQAANTDSLRPIGEPISGLITNKSGNQFIELAGGGYLMMTKLVPVTAQLGYAAGWGDQDYIQELPDFPIYVKELHKGEYRSFVSGGDSMNDESKRSIESGDIVTGRLINRALWRSKFHMNSFPEYIIVHRTLGVMCKQIIEHDVEHGVITCHSYNPDKERYPDFMLPLDDVSQIYNVVQITKGR